MDEQNVRVRPESTSVIQPQTNGTVQDVVQQAPVATPTPFTQGTTQNDTIPSPYDSLDGDENAESLGTTSVSQSTASNNTQTILAQQAPAPKKSGVGVRDRELNKVLTRVIVGGVVIMLLLFGGVSLANRLSSNRPVDPIAGVAEQELSSLNGGNAETLGIETSNSTLLVNGNILTIGELQVSDGTVTSTIALTQGASGRTYTLPDSSGVFCLDSNNCGYLQADDVTNTTIAGNDGDFTIGAGLSLSNGTISNTIVQTSVNNSMGAITLQGTNNQVTITKNGNTFTLSGPQDLGVTDAPTFSSITLTNVGTQNGNVLCDISNNCGYAGGANAFIQNGNSFGTTAVLGTNDSYGLLFETNNITQATLAVGGAFTLQNSVDSTGAFLVMDADGGTPVLAVDTTNERVGIGTAAPAVELEVVGDTIISDRLQIGPTGDTIDQCASIFGPLTCDVALDVANSSTETTNTTYGIYSNVGITPGATNTAGVNYASASVLALYGSNDFTGANVAVSGLATSAATAGTVAQVVGVKGNAGMLVSSSTATVTQAIGLQAGIGIANTTSGGTITSGYGVYIDAASLAGVGASIGTNYGIYVSPQTSGGSDYGIAVGAADTQTLWLSSNADNTSASAGIAFGLSRDTNLYRSAANTLRTDDALSVGDDITVTGDILPSADDTYDLGSNSNRWRDLYLGPATLSIGTSATDYKISYDTGNNALLFNNGQDDRDFRIAGDTQANLLYVDAGNNRIGIGTSTPGYELDVVGTINASTGINVNGTQVCTASGCIAAPGSGNYIQNGTSIQTNTNFAIQSAAAGSIGAVIRGAASQTASLQEWQNSSGTTLLRVNQNGTIQNITGNANAFLSSTTLGLAGGGGIQVQSGSDLNLTTSGVGQIVLTTGGSARFRVTDGGVAMVGSSGTAGTVEKFRVNTPTTVDNLAATILSTGATTSKGLVVQGAASQTANLQEWQDSSGTILTRVNADGSIALGGVNTASTGALRLANNTYIYARNAANTGNKQLLGYDSADNVVLGGSGTSVNVYIMNAIGSGIGVSTTAISSGPGKGIYQTGSALGLYHYNGNITLTPGASSSFASVLTAARSGTNITVQTAATTDIGLVVKGTASQTANLQEWQDSTGSVLASVGATGNISITNADTPGTRIMLNQTNPNHQAYLQTNYTGNSQGYRIGQSNSTGPEFFVQSTQSNNYFIRGGYNNMAVVIGPSADQRAAISDYGSNSAATLIVQDSRASVGATRLVVRAGAGQSTTNLQEWQNSAGTVLTSISANGILNVSSSASGTEHDLGVNQGVRIGTFARFGSGSGGASAGAIRLFNNTFVNWRNAANSADIGIRVDTNNTLQLGAAATTLDTVADTTIGTSGTTRKGLVIQGVASQTASLQEWQSSTGTVLASIAADGDLEVVDATVNGNLVVDGTATFNGNITVNGHVITGNTSGSTTVTVNTTGAGTGASASISGNDTAGVITINTGTGAAAGTLATVTFANAFGSAPEVIITPKSIPGGGTFPQYHFDSATTTFDLKAFNALTDSSTYTFTYMIVE